MKPSYWFSHSSGVGERQDLSVCPGDHLGRTHLKQTIHVQVIYINTQNDYENMPMQYTDFFTAVKNETF